MTSRRLEYLFIHFLHVLFAVFRYLEVPNRRLGLRLRRFAPFELVHVWAAEAVAPVFPSLLFHGFRPAFLVLVLAGALVLVPAGALVLLPAGALVVLPLPAVLLPAALLPAVPLPVGLLVLSVAALLPEDFLAAPEAEAAAAPPLLEDLASIYLA
jgi:hypothetical protein